jgi:hypothetical protein
MSAMLSGSKHKADIDGVGRGNGALVQNISKNLISLTTWMTRG